MESFDIVIVGGGVIGSAIAFNLLCMDPELTVMVVERDPTYRTASSALSASSIRQQFSTPVNIAMSRYSMAFFQQIGTHLAVEGETPDIGLTERGYLYLTSEAGRETLASNHALQRQCDVQVALLEKQELAQRFPWLAIDDLALGSLGLSGEGWFDGYSVLQAFRRKARALGAKYVTGEVGGFQMDRNQVNGVSLLDGSRIACGKVVNAAGPQAGQVARMAGIDLPVAPEKHCIFVFDCKEPPPAMPLIIDPSGVYCRPEGRYFIAGPPGQEDRPVDNTNLDVDHSLFDDIVWPTLAARVPAFESIKLINAWAGFYEMSTFDHNALLGAASAVPNLYFANGFSGHGMQHSPAAGLGLAELILHDRYVTLDLSALSYERVARGEPVREINII